MNRTPLGKRTGFNEVNARVTVRLIQLDHKRSPEAYRKHKATAILDLADRLRADHITSVWPYLISAAKAVQLGSTLDAWRGWALTQSHDTLRSIHKRPFRPRT